MTSPLYRPEIKIRRARRKLGELEGACGKFFQENTPVLVFDTDTQPGHKLAKIRLDASLPEDVHVITGEIIYHLRSSLDQIAVAFGRMSAAQPNVKNIYFPTGDNLTGFNADVASKLAGVDADLVQEIVGLKPYDGGDDTLRAIFRMANVDKHLELIPASTAGHLAGMNDFTIRGAWTAFIIGGMESLKDGVIISDLFPEGTITPNNPDAKIRIAGDILLGNVSIYNGEQLLPFLDRLVTKGEEVYGHLAGFCRRTSRI
ncbi:hypothetical protein [Mesorhizobium muleiense]|uniref:hypothetical protein n=1 Tax=Mesorhizobium muleiense TaxID=1004279 RepID=UPI001F1CDD76|nr:hypothetical protein [Mesorhizobium muleiense]MCF6113882.1 hypothetical protein [Mesorhizobium muleiense]